MNIREIVKEAIEQELPFLKKIKIQTSDDKRNDFITSDLLPYLFYSNTIDKNYRIIPIFLRKKEDIILLPLYYSVALFKTYADLYLKLNKFSNIYFSKEDPIRIVDIEGDVGKLESINFVSQELTISCGMGERKIFNFNELAFLEFKNQSSRGYYRKLEYYFNLIRQFQKTIKISQNPFELIGLMSDEYFKRKNIFSGAVFFTQELSLLRTDFYRDYKINDFTFFNTIPSSRVEINENRIEFKNLADKRVLKKRQLNKVNEFLIFSHLKHFRGYEKLVEEKDWINTIIYDFTKDTKDIDQVLNLIENSYATQVNGTEIKDIYLVFNEKDLDCYKQINQRTFESHPFLLNKNQKNHFLNLKTEIQDYSTIVIPDIDFDSKFRKLYNIIKEFCTRIHLSDLYSELISPLFEIKKRFNSFYNPQNLNKQILV